MDNDELNPKTARLVYSGPSELGTLRVYENELYRWLGFDNQQAHSAMLLTQPWKPVLPYYPLLLSSLIFQPMPVSVLLLGLGGGDLLRFYHHHLPVTRVKLVDMSAVVVDACRHYFLPASNITDTDVLQMDVCEYLESTEHTRFDTIYLDVYGENALPDCFYSEKFYWKLRERINAQGVVAVNFVVKDEEDALHLMRLMYEGFQQHILCLSVENYMNLVILGFRQDPLSMPDIELRQSLQKLGDKYSLDIAALLANIRHNNPHLEQKIEKIFGP